MTHDNDIRVVDISNAKPSRGDYICPFCCVIMLSGSPHTDTDETEDVNLDIEVRCPSCGYKLNPITDQGKHASKSNPKILRQ